MTAQYLQQKSILIEQALNELVSESSAVNNELLQAARYALLNGGKRLRPMLTLATAEAFGVDTSATLIPACAVEIIHTYSLIHDDLPCMDDDDFRRGKPSLHKAFNEGLAVLTGDYLLTFAFEILSTAPMLSANQKIALIALLARNSGANGMVGGQVLDIAAEGHNLALEQLRHIHMLKTGALLSASVEFGAIIGNATPAQSLLLRQFGLDIGLAFQIVDDVIDVTSSLQKHGRVVASDACNNKTTYVSLLGLDGAKKAAYELFDNALTHLDVLKDNCDTAALKELAERLVNRTI